jgi:hypothetical protein
VNKNQGAAFHIPLRCFLVSSTLVFAHSFAERISIYSSKALPSFSPPSASAGVGFKGELWA